MFFFRVNEIMKMTLIVPLVLLMTNGKQTELTNFIHYIFFDLKK